MFRSAAIFGQPVAHSRSPFIHGAWLHDHKISGAYLRQEISLPALPTLLRDFHKTGLIGANLTLPLKEAACAYVELDEIAAKLQAVNTLWVEDRKLRGTNTDVYGFTAACDEQAPGWKKALNNAVVLGAGGTAKAVVYALQNAGAERITLINRTKSRAEALGALFGAKVKSGGWDRLSALLPQASMLVNATSLGMQGQPQLPLDIKQLGPDAIVADIVYAPLETKLLYDAKAKGLKIVDGLSMLLHQAAPAFARWFGVEPKVTESLRAFVAADLKAI
jgi:shikimate dehydrogenase